MAVDIEKMRSELRREARVFAVQLVLGGVAMIGVGLAFSYFLTHRAP